MGLIEFIGEIYNPGKVGEIDFNRNSKPPRRKYILLKFLIAALAITGIEYLFVYTFYETKIKDILPPNGFLFAYLILSYKINITPDYQNTGWVPFIIDNPFRFSDDVNRASIMIKGLLWPGKFITTSFVDFYYLKDNKSNI